jgi:hypothetical protein
VGDPRVRTGGLRVDPYPRVGSGRVGSGRVGSGRVGSGKLFHGSGRKFKGRGRPVFSRRFVAILEAKGDHNIRTKGRFCGLPHNFLRRLIT